MHKSIFALLSIWILLATSPSSLSAQCPDFDPTITISPVDADGIYCPGQTITLTTQSYDSYQWFYNFSNSNSGGTVWAGGTGNSIQMSASQWAVVYFYVEATDDGCTEASPTIVWDAWNFLPPSISSSGQSNYCTGESTTISNAFPGPSFFQWYKNGAIILNATNSTYDVTETGTYTLSAAYAECPNYWQSSGVGPSFTFTDPIVPVITEVGGDLMADSGTSWQWIFDDKDIPGATSSSYKPEEDGEYKVRVIDVNGCEATSAPFVFPQPPLAVNLINMNIEPLDCAVKINWQTATSSPGVLYAVQYSANGSIFNTLQEIDNPGDFHTAQIPMNETSGYFRLEMTEADGSITYSPRKFVSEICGDFQKCCSVFPNPVSDVIQLEKQHRDIVNIRIVDPLGQLLYQGVMDSPSQSVDIKDWPNAVYRLLMEYGGKTESHTIIKQ